MGSKFTRWLLVRESTFQAQSLAPMSYNEFSLETYKHIYLTDK